MGDVLVDRLRIELSASKVQTSTPPQRPARKRIRLPTSSSTRCLSSVLLETSSGICRHYQPRCPIWASTIIKNPPGLHLEGPGLTSGVLGLHLGPSWGACNVPIEPLGPIGARRRARTGAFERWNR